MVDVGLVNNGKISRRALTGTQLLFSGPCESPENVILAVRVLTLRRRIQCYDIVPVLVLLFLSSCLDFSNFW